MNKPKVYIASKLQHAEKWKALRKEWAPSLDIISSWINKYGTVGDNPAEAGRFWQEDFEDINTAHYLICYGEPSEHLRGALVEAGAMIMNGGTVIVVGEHPDYGTWQYHKYVVKVATLTDALQFIIDDWRT